MSIAEAMELSEYQIYTNPSLGPSHSRIFIAADAVIKAFKQAGVKPVLVGGLAVNHYVEPRATKDIDLILLADDEKLVLKALEKANFVKQKPGKLSHLGKAKVVKMLGPYPYEVEIDLLMSNNKFFGEVLRNSKYDKSSGMYVPPIEALVVMKLLSHEDRKDDPREKVSAKGFQDLADVKLLMAQKKHSNDEIKRYADLLGVKVNGR